MKISYNWLKNYINLNIDPQEVERILSSIGLEVEGMEDVEQIPGGLEGVVVGEVMECIKHPDADKLSVTKVNTGGDELLQIVCGAPNVAAGQKVLVATVGTNLTFTGGDQIKIKKSKIRGVESAGMICAEDELGIGTSHEGIMVLPENTKIGTAAREFLNLKSDTIFEIGLTPNRVDAASHIGVARDLSSYLRLNGKSGEMQVPSVAGFSGLERSKLSTKPIEVVVETPLGSPRYSGLTFDNIKIAPSPEWLQTALKSVGLRPINNVVDITNFILQETGQPLHAFDYNQIEGGKIIVKEAKDGEHFVTLDGVERELSSEDVMICNAKSPMCIGGVFGGLQAGVSNDTTAIFLESAYFNPVSIRKTSKRHSLKTDASFRYERGADPAIVPYALKRAAILLQEIAGARIVGDIKEVYPKPIERAKISLNFERIEDFIGKKIGSKTIMDILSFMDFEVVWRDESGAEVFAPLYMVDVTRECDVVEEVLRIYGYNNIELPTSVHASINATPKPDPERVRTLASDFLANNGFFEIMSNSLTKSEYYSKLKTFPKEKLVMILNPLSSDLNSMRQTLILNGLEVIEYNINRQHPDLKLFEMGNVYSIESGLEKNDLSSYTELPKLSIFVTGPGNTTWRANAKPASYFSLKGCLELLFTRFGIEIDNLEYSTAPADIFAEGFVYKTVGCGKEIAVMGTISNLLLKQFGIKQPVFAAEISWNVLFNQIKKQKVLYKELPKFPEVKRDLALLINENVSFAELRKAAFKTEKKILKQVTLFDVYRGDKIPTGKKQYALSFTLQDLEKTLTDKYVEDVMNKLLTAFMEHFGASIR